MGKDMEYKEDLIVEGDILGKNGKRYNLKVNGNITAKNITARNINAMGNINARNINAWNIIADDINARGINANIISYYAVCFAYFYIKCKSIKGQMNNSRHFVLDGKIEVGK